MSVGGFSTGAGSSFGGRCGLRSGPVILFINGLVGEGGIRSLVRTGGMSRDSCCLMVINSNPRFGGLDGGIRSRGVRSMVFANSEGSIRGVVPDYSMLILPSCSRDFNLILVRTLTYKGPIVKDSINNVARVVGGSINLLMGPGGMSSVTGTVSAIVGSSSLELVFSLGTHGHTVSFSRMAVPCSRIGW